MEGNKYRDMSYAESAARDNSLFSAFTQKWGFHVRPAYSADKLIFSFVELGTNGKGNSFNIHMSTIRYGAPCFYKWAKDILSPNCRFEKIMAKEAERGEKYPSYYKYVTGSKANKSIGICNSTKGGYCITGSVKEEVDGNTVNKYCAIPVDIGDLMLIAEMFMRSYKQRLDELETIRREEESRRADYLKSDTNESELTPVIEDVTPVGNMVIKTRIKMPVMTKEGATFEGINLENHRTVKLFAPADIMRGEEKETWKKLASALSNKETTVFFEVTGNDDVYTILGFASQS